MLLEAFSVPTSSDGNFGTAAISGEVEAEEMGEGSGTLSATLAAGNDASLCVSRCLTRAMAEKSAEERGTGTPQTRLLILRRVVTDTSPVGVAMPHGGKMSA